jgi:hypothetical protein
MSPSSLTAQPSSPPSPLLDLPIHLLDLVNTVYFLCTLALVDDPRCQPPMVSPLASPVPWSKPRYLSFTAPGPSVRNRLTFTFAIDHRLRALHLHTTSKRHVAQPKLHASVSSTTQPKALLTLTIIHHKRNHMGIYRPCGLCVRSFFCFFYFVLVV